MIKYSRKKEYYRKIYNKLSFETRKNANFLSRIKNFLNRVPKRFINAFFILILSFCFVLIFVNGEKFSPDYIGIFFEDLFAQMQAGSGYPYKIDGNKVSNENFKTVDKSLFLVSDAYFTTLNNSARVMLKNPHCYQNPMIKVCKTRAVIYDLGGKNLKLISKSQILHSMDTENNLISVDISDYGTFAVVTEAKGFLSQLIVYGKNGKDIYYKYNFAEHYVTDVTLSPDGKSVAVCACTAKEGSILSSVYVFDYKSEVPIVKFDYEDNVFLRIKYLSNGNIAVLGEKLTSIVNPKNCTKEDFFYDNKNLVGFDINIREGVLLTLSISEDGNNSEIFVLNKKGKLEASFRIDHDVKALSFNNRKIAALSYGKIYIYNFAGKRIKSLDAGNDAQNIGLVSNKDYYILGVNEVRKIRF